MSYNRSPLPGASIWYYIFTTAFPCFVLFLIFFFYIVDDALLLATQSGGALVLFLIPSHCRRCIIIGYSKWGRFGAVLNSFALSKMHYYWLLKRGYAVV